MVTTTLAKNSQVGDDWIRRALAECPPQFARDAAGNPNGNILTGPVRLAFTDAVFHKKPKMGTDPNSVEAHSVTLLFTPQHDMSVIWQEYYRIGMAEFATAWNPQLNGFVGLVPPWRDGAEKANFDGFMPGVPFMIVRSGYAPTVVDRNMNPIVNEKDIYPGCWAIVALQPYAGGKGKPKKGPMFGLQSIMKIADDTNLAGSAPDPRSMFGGVKTVAPPVGGATQAFAAASAAAPQMPGAGVAGVMGGGYGAQHLPPAGYTPPPADDDPNQFM